MAELRPMRAGALTEAKAVAALLQRGYRVAIPVVDDDGVDLVVEYRFAVQVKGTATPYTDHYGKLRESTFSWRVPLVDHVDVLMLHAAPADAWFILPAEILRAGDARGRSRTLTVTLDRGPRGRKPNFVAEWRDAWHVFDGHEGTLSVLAS